MYNSFSIVWFNAFTLSERSDSLAGERSRSGGELCRKYESRIDDEIFDRQFLDRDLLRRYRIEGFDIEIKPENTPTSPVVRGRVHVEAASYFNTTMTVTYRLVVCKAEGMCTASAPLNSDQIIILAGMPVGVEHWHVDTHDPSRGKIDLAAHKCRISNLPLDADGRYTSQPQTLEGSNEVLEHVFARYRAYLNGGGRTKASDYDSNFILIDVWEDIGHSRDSRIQFQGKEAPDIISHIASEHRSELMGLLTLYPYEWPYRDQKAFHRVCGDNIAIDTDDLVLVSDNVALVIGTYGLRGEDAPTNWKRVLEKRAFEHVCWPEYLHILDIIIAKLHTINSGLYRLQTASSTTHPNTNHKAIIRNNSLVTMEVSRMVVDMDAINFSRYASHKLMYRKTEERLEVQKESDMLVSALQQLDISIKNVDNVDELKRSRVVRLLLAFITVASVFQVLFEDTKVPIAAWLVDPEFAATVGVTVILTVIFGIFMLGVTIMMSGVWSGLRWVRELLHTGKRL